MQTTLNPLYLSVYPNLILSNPTIQSNPNQSNQKWSNANPSIHPYTHSSIYLSVCLSVCLSVSPSVHPSIHPSISVLHVCGAKSAYCHLSCRRARYCSSCSRISAVFPDTSLLTCPGHSPFKLWPQTERRKEELPARTTKASCEGNCFFWQVWAHS